MVTPLPPLPEPSIFEIDDSGYHVGDGPVYFTAEQMTEYAQQATKAALLWAAELCREHKGCRASDIEPVLRAKAEKIK